MTNKNDGPGKGPAKPGGDVGAQKKPAALIDLKAVLGSSDRDLIQQKLHALNEATHHLAEVMMNKSVHAALSGRNVEDI